MTATYYTVAPVPIRDAVLQSVAPAKPAQIKVVGVGGGGCNAIDRMIADGVQGVDFIAVNTDAQALVHSRAPVRVQIGTQTTSGLGSGGVPLVGKHAAQEQLDELRALLDGANMVFVTAGMGGGTGTGAAPVIATLARELGALTVAMVTRPFGFEGNYRRKMAEYGLEQLRAAVDTLIVLPNDRLLHLSAANTSMLQAFQMADSMLRQGIQGISDLIVQPGLINVDFADVRSIMAQAGSALMAIGVGSGSNRVADAVQLAIASPLLEVSVEGARAVLFNVSCNEDLGILELYEAADIIRSAVDPEANIIFGAVIDPQVPIGQVKVTLIATGFDIVQQQQIHTLPPPGHPAARGSLQQRATATPAKPIEVSAHRLNDDELSIPPFLRNRIRNREQ